MRETFQRNTGTFETVLSLPVCWCFHLSALLAGAHQQACFPPASCVGSFLLLLLPGDTEKGSASSTMAGVLLLSPALSVLPGKETLLCYFYLFLIFLLILQLHLLGLGL